MADRSKVRDKTKAKSPSPGFRRKIEEPRCHAAVALFPTKVLCNGGQALTCSKVDAQFQRMNHTDQRWNSQMLGG